MLHGKHCCQSLSLFFVSRIARGLNAKYDAEGFHVAC